MWAKHVQGMACSLYLTTHQGSGWHYIWPQLYYPTQMCHPFKATNTCVSASFNWCLICHLLKQPCDLGRACDHWVYWEWVVSITKTWGCWEPVHNNWVCIMRAIKGIWVIFWIKENNWIFIPVLQLNTKSSHLVTYHKPNISFVLSSKPLFF